MLVQRRREGDSPGVGLNQYEGAENGSKELNVEGCVLSVPKVVAFAVLCLTIVPLLIIKWSKRARRWFLYSAIDMQRATRVVVRGTSTLKLHVDDSFDIIPLSRVTTKDPDTHETKTNIVSFICYPSA